MNVQNTFLNANRNLIVSSYVLSSVINNSFKLMKEFSFNSRNE